MRLKVVITILMLATGLLAGIFLLAKMLRTQSTDSLADNREVTNIVATATSANLPVIVKIPDPQPMAVIPAPVVNTNAAAEHDRDVARRIHELNDLAMNNDMASRNEILSEVKNNPDKEIRAAALEAAIQFNDRSVVPPLQEIAQQTQDPEEKASILEAIDYINLPSLTEYQAAHPENSIPRRTPKIMPPRHTAPPPSNSGNGQAGQ